MKAKFVYLDNSDHPNVKMIFEIVAESISEADKAYENATGKDPKYQPYVGCQIYSAE